MCRAGRPCEDQRPLTNEKGAAISLRLVSVGSPTRALRRKDFAQATCVGPDLTSGRIQLASSRYSSVRVARSTPSLVMALRVPSDVKT